MKKLLAFICLCIQIVPIMGQSVLRTSHGVKVETKAACVELECFSSSIIRVKKYPLGQAPEKQSLSVTMVAEVNECHASHFAAALHPTCQRYLLIDIGDTKFSAGV